jgi:phospholipid/cholesterol/gamma-HCH transport system ATP-binding protein
MSERTSENSGRVPAIELRNVEKAFSGKEVLRGVNVKVYPGETFTLLGGSGSGKSVCLKHMVGLLAADKGQVLIDGKDMTCRRETEWVSERRRFGVLFQGAALFDSLNVHENIAYPLRQHLDLSPAELSDRVDECLVAVGLPGTEKLMPAELSGGMKKRIGLARAIAMQPEFILYDEPTTGLDPANQKRVGDLIVELQERLKVTSVVVTHELDLCFSISDRVSLLKDGSVVAQGNSEEMRSSSHPDVQAFLEGRMDDAAFEGIVDGLDAKSE